jgi:hypothetical protein
MRRPPFWSARAIGAQVLARAAALNRLDSELLNQPLVGLAAHAPPNADEAVPWTDTEEVAGESWSVRSCAKDPDLIAADACLLDYDRGDGYGIDRLL